MRVAKWGNSLAIRIPAEVAERRRRGKTGTGRAGEIAEASLASADGAWAQRKFRA